MPDTIFVGQFGAPFGIRGALKLVSHTHNPVDIFTYGALTTEDGQPLSIKMQRFFKERTFVVDVKDVKDRNGADLLKGQKLFVTRDALPAQSSEDEFYYHDLVGLMLVDEEDQEWGRVESVQNFGAGDFLEFHTPKGKQATIPFSKDAVLSVDLSTKRIQINSTFVCV